MLLDITSGTAREIHVPDAQVGALAADLLGRRLAFVEGLASDRGILAGDLMVLDVDRGTVRRVDTALVDVSFTSWRSTDRLLVAGLRGDETVVQLHDFDAGVLRQSWSSRALSSGGVNASVAPVGDRGDFLILAEGFAVAPELAAVRAGAYRRIRSFCLHRDEGSPIAETRALTWRGKDGAEVQGFLLIPAREPPFPVVMNIHGGPSWHWRPRWMGRGAYAMLLLLRRGVAVFLPNPRGSTGRGQPFARAVVGDLGGVDADDCLAGLDHLVAEGLADPVRLGVTGGSYGGFMTAWLATREPRLAAVVAQCPITNHVSHQLTSNIPHFSRLFLDDDYGNLGGKHFQRSPVLFAGQVTAPVLTICGSLDRCTPPGEAAQFHAALIGHGLRSVLLTYPEEGHGVRKAPASLDCAARIVDWFETHLRAMRTDGA